VTRSPSNCRSASIQSPSESPGSPSCWRRSAMKQARSAMSSVLIADGPAVFFFAGLAFGAAPALRAAAFGFAAVIR